MKIEGQRWLMNALWGALKYMLSEFWPQKKQLLCLSFFIFPFSLLSGVLWVSAAQGGDLGAFSRCWSPGMLAEPPLALADTFNSAVIPPCLISPQTTVILPTETLHCRACGLPAQPGAPTQTLFPPPPSLFFLLPGKDFRLHTCRISDVALHGFYFEGPTAQV